MVLQGRKKAAKAASEEQDWEPQRFRVLRQLYTVLQLQLRRLWDPPVPDEEFVKYVIIGAAVLDVMTEHVRVKGKMALRLTFERR